MHHGISLFLFSVFLRLFLFISPLPPHCPFKFLLLRALYRRNLDPGELELNLTDLRPTANGQQLTSESQRPRVSYKPVVVPYLCWHPSLMSHRASLIAHRPSLITHDCTLLRLRPALQHQCASRLRGAALRMSSTRRIISAASLALLTTWRLSL